MYHLYAPWRGTYTQKEHTQKGIQSPFTTIFESNNDTEYFILKRLKHTGIILNQYPYNPGHLLVIPYREVGRLDALIQAERFELMEATTHSVKILEETIKNPGTNVGLNLGDKASGGSILEHIHMHVIPRWHGDTSFLPLTAETKVLSEDLRTVYETLREPFEQVTITVPEL